MGITERLMKEQYNQFKSDSYCQDERCIEITRREWPTTELLNRSFIMLDDTQKLPAKWWTINWISTELKDELNGIHYDAQYLVLGFL